MGFHGQKNTKQKLGDSRGTAYIEFVICIPLFITLFMALMESARWFEAQMMVSRVAYEAARYAATLDNLTPTAGEVVEAYANGDKGRDYQAELEPDQKAILQRIRANLALMDGGTVNRDQLAGLAQVKLMFTKDTALRNQKPIKISISLPYHPMFQIFPVDRVSATGQANYLWKTIN